MKKILELEQNQDNTFYHHSKINELVRSFNELLLSLKPSAQEPKENKGYENKSFDNEIKETE